MKSLMLSNSLSIRLYKHLKNKTVFYVYVPLIFYWIFLFTLTTIPTDAIPQIFYTQDKLEHLTAYFFLAILMNLTLHFQKKYSLFSKYSTLFSFVLIILYAAVDELHQLMVPGRYCDFYDFLADSVGGILGILLIFVFIRNSNAEIHEEIP